MTALRRQLPSAAIVIAAVTALLSLTGTATAAPGVPHWQIRTFSYPTNFVPKSTGTEAGPGFFIVASNIGSERTSGTFTVTDTLPAGLTVSPSKSPAGSFGRNLTVANPFSCESVGQVVTCTGAAPGVAPGETVQVTVPVKLSNTATGSVTNTATISGGGAPTATATATTEISAESALFDFMPGDAGLGASVTDADGSVVSQAGRHPFQVGLNLGLNTASAPAGASGPLAISGGLRDLAVTFPPGVVVNPTATPKCPEVLLESSGCPDNTQIGLVRLWLGAIAVAAPLRSLYNIVPPPGVPAEFGFEVLEGTYVHVQGKLRSDGQYELSGTVNDAVAKVNVIGAETVLWGNPTSEAHDWARGDCVLAHKPEEATMACPVPRTNTALLTMPSACSGPIQGSAEVDGWIEPAIHRKNKKFEAADATGTPIEKIEGCENLDFEPTISLDPEVPAADSGTGLSVHLHIPQNEEYEDELEGPLLAESTLKEARVVLPQGMTVNPSAANGRDACTPAQIGLATAVGDPHPTFTMNPDTCPNSAKVGSVEVLTPLLVDEPETGKQVPHPVPGAIYLAQPFANPFNSLLGVYLAIDDPQTGLVIKLAGKVEADPATGQLTTTFSDNPQLPFEDFKLTFFGGPRAALRTPVLCGAYASQSVLTPWSGTAPVPVSSPFPIVQGANGQACATDLKQLPNKPAFEAGTTSPLAGRYSPFVLKLSRQDGSQEFSALNVTMPPGLTGKLANTPYCPEAAIAASATKTGREELASPSCPAASEVGRVVVGAGAGSSPYFTQGKVYLAGPYKGAPLSLAIVTPAVAGPFDLGTVVVRSALQPDIFSAQISVKSDPLPTILKGIPLDVRSIVVEVGKPEFTLNPTSCEPAQVQGEAVSTTGQAAPLQAHFQVSGCKNLKFKPKLKISLKGAVKRSGHPALKAVATFPTGTGFANVARAQVALPHSEFLDQGNLNNVCTQPQLKSHTCPAKSIYGRAKAWTPLLDKPLEGNVYLGVGFGHSLPDLVAELDGQIRILVHGRVDTDSDDGIRNTFEAVPDAPVSKFVLEMQGGKKKGLLENSENICRKKNLATVKFVAQTGTVLTTKQPIQTSCKGKKAKRKASKGRSQ